MKKVYLAIPYTGMEESSYKQSVEATANIMKNNPNVTIYSPIVSSHPLTAYGLRGDFDYWKDICLEWLALCDTLVVVIPKEGMGRARASKGLQDEYYFAKENDMKILAVDFKDTKNLII